MEKDTRTPWTLVALALIAGAVAGALAVNVWTHSYRYRDLETAQGEADPKTGDYVGSASCRECHEQFYELWAPSHHGKAMQPVTAELVREALSPLAEPIEVRGVRFGVDLERHEIVEEADGKRKEYPMLHAMGGKNVFFFLTPLERGRLQVLPLSYDVNRKKWIDTTGSMVRHFADREDEALDWRDPLLTFNTACYNCHVSQLDKNYDAATDTYHTTWREPGINCEACHGPGQEHNRVCRAVPEGTVPKDLRTIRWRDFTREQTNDACAPCHAKGRPVAAAFVPGARFFDHYDLVCLEDRDFYPDGRDLGENYTQTGWMMNPCVQPGMLDCTHCHTSSGRFRQKDDPSASCLPCHAQRVRKIGAHSRHPASAKAPTCVSCHSPMTEFSRMRRSDHSFRPPCPQASIRFGSPNACLMCHQGKTNEWAAGKVGEWHPENRWRAKILREGALVDAARKDKWEQLPEIMAYVRDPSSEPVVVTSLIRLTNTCPKPSKWPAIRQNAKHASPLVRAAAVEALADDIRTSESASLLLEALSDDYRVVRVRAVASLAQYPRASIGPKHVAAFTRAEEELMASFAAQPDAWSSYYNLGNYRSAQGDSEGALEAYERAIALRHDVVLPYVNASVTASKLGRLDDSIKYLLKAHPIEPDNAAVNLNLGLALAERGDAAGAEKHLRLAVKRPGSRGQAAYNLAVLVASRDKRETVKLCRQATAAEPDNPRYAYTLAYYLAETGNPAEAAAVLEPLIRQHRNYADAWVLLGRCYEKVGKPDGAVRHYQAMRKEASLPTNARQLAERQLQRLGRK